MTLGEKLLDLSIEYAESKTSRTDGFGFPAGREPSVIAEEYAITLRSLLNQDAPVA